MVLRRRQPPTSNLRVPPPRPPDVARRHAGVLELASLLPPPVVWVLGGGGAHGAVQLGTLQAVSETDLRPHQVIGSSAGALTGAVIAEDPVSAVNRLSYLWAAIDLTDIVSGGWTSLVSPANLTRPSLADSAGERASLEEVYAAREFTDLLLPFAAVATDMISGQPALFDSGPLIDALLASSAIPGVLPPVQIDGRWYIDALASANLPASLGMRLGAGSLVVFDTGTSSERVAGSGLTQLVPALNNLLARRQRESSLTQAAHHLPVIYLPTPTGLAGTLRFKDSLGTARAAYELAQAFLIDLATAYRGRKVPLSRGLYARPDALDVHHPSVGKCLRPVLPTTVDAGAGEQEAP